VDYILRNLCCNHFDFIKFTQNLFPMQKIQNYINGALVAPTANNYMDNYEPATGKVYSQIPNSDETDFELAVKAAKEAYKSWSSCGIAKRSEVLLKISNLIEENLDNLALAESIDNGKPVWLAKLVDIPRAASNFHFFATAIEHFASESHYMEEIKAINFTTRKPIGVVGCISPWNLPLYLFTWKIAPALAAGNCVVAKPSEVTPMTSFLLSKICIEAGLPKGVLNIVHGLGHSAGSAIVSHPEVKAISFTGGTNTGKAIAKVAAPMFKKLSLELGGKNPNIIFDDANLDKAVEMAVKSSFSNQGQICLCGSRIFVQEGIYDLFKEKYIAAVDNLKVGDPNDDDSNLGALVSKAHYEKVLSYIDIAKAEGGTVISGGTKVSVPGRCETGYFMRPTVIEGLDYTCRTNQEEIFGPIVTLTPFKTEEDVLEMANSVDYGLSATIFTQDIDKAHRVADEIEAGIVWINTWLLRDLRTPFGGVKSSGVGREGGFEALKFFTEPKNICIKY
jgi:aminomuconate-semialdehyde/2-hydroxymuconate-6-semialdehyde dehydrogenase